MAYIGSLKHKKNLRSQLSQLNDLCELYDQGKHQTALYMTGIFRTIFHKKGLLCLLKSEQLPIRDTCSDLPLTENTGLYESYMRLYCGANGMVVVPKLNFGTSIKYRSASTWWTQTVRVMGPDRYTRKSIILTVADKIVLHPDENMPDDMARLIEHGHYTDVNKSEPAFPDIMHLIGIRQFAFELLNSPELIDL